MAPTTPEQLPPRDDDSRAVLWLGFGGAALMLAASFVLVRVLRR
jgi:hypothetical protein